MTRKQSQTTHEATPQEQIPQAPKPQAPKRIQLRHQAGAPNARPKNVATSSSKESRSRHGKSDGITSSQHVAHGKAITGAEVKSDDFNGEESGDGLAEQGDDALELLEGTPHKSEPSGAIMACNEFLFAGPSRSVRGMAQAYKERPRHEVPTQSYDTLRRWSEKYDWTKRAAAYDSRKGREQMAARQKILNSGHAAELLRVESLSRISQLLEAQILEVGIPQEKPVLARCPDCDHIITVTTGNLVDTYPNLFTTTVKETGEGESKRTTVTRRFNGGLVSQLRGLMNDLSKETGGRRSNFADKVISRLDLTCLPPEFAHRIYFDDNPEDALVELIETFYTDNPMIHLQRNNKNDRGR